LSISAFIAALSSSVLFTALFALKFRYWRQPKILIAYLGFFLGAEWLAHAYVLPPEAFGNWLSILCGSLTVPVLAAIYLLDRHERKHDRTEG